MTQEGSTFDEYGSLFPRKPSSIPLAEETLKGIQMNFSRRQACSKKMNSFKRGHLRPFSR